MAKDKKVTFKHFENKKIKQREIQTIEGSYYYSTLYFRLTYERKTSEYNSYLFWDILNEFIYPEGSNNISPLAKAEIEKNWPSIVSTIQEKDSAYIDILIKGIFDKFGYFDFNYFKKTYYDNLSNFLLGIDNRITKGIIENLSQKKDLPATSELLKHYFQPREHINKYGIYNTSIKYEYPFLFTIIKEISGDNIEAYINESTLKLTKVFKLLFDNFSYDFPIKTSELAFLPIGYIKFETGRSKLKDLLMKEYSEQETYSIVEILDNIYSEFFL